MEFEDVVVKENPGLCRCCLSEGCYKDLGSEYSWMNETEVYADMLLECFDISISQHMDGPNGPNRLICEVCITRLRDACNFKKQVLESEKKFIDMVARGDFRSKVLYEPVLKAEVIAEAPAEEDEVEYLEDDLDFDDNDDVPLSAAVDAMPGASGQDITVSSLKVPRPKRGRPKKSATSPEKPERKSKVAKIEEKARSSKNVRDDDYLQCVLDGRADLSFANLRSTDTASKRIILATILQRTTAMPFRWFNCKFLCFYCSMNFYDSAQLKQHTKTEHDDAKLRNVLLRVLPTTRIKLDVSEMRCKVCAKPLRDLNDFLRHSNTKHSLKMHEDALTFVESFKLSDVMDLSCAECGESFKFFAPLLHHVHQCHNKGTPHICEFCGKNFVSAILLDSHVKNHEIPGPCKECGEVCATAYAMQAHQVRAHGDRRFQCTECPELLASAQLKRKHLAAVHNVNKSEFRCEECGKVMARHSTYLHHKLRVHSQLKAFSCEVCDHKVYSKRDLNLHMVKHSGDKCFECKFCKKRFARKKGLEIHVRIHTNDKRYACNVCDKAFVQTSSLKCHMKTHHPE